MIRCGEETLHEAKKESKITAIRDTLSWLHFTGPIVLVTSASILSLINRRGNNVIPNSTNFQSK